MSSAIQVAKTVTYLPDLVEVQRASFKWFLEKGLIEELDSFSPITDYTGKLELHFIGDQYRLKRPRHDVEEAKRRDATFASQMYVTCRLVNKETGEIKEQEVFIGELPLMTERGTFIINGAERVIVNQIVRSPGVYFKDEQDKNGRKTFNASLIPNRGAWLKFETDKNDLLHVRVDKTRKINAHVLMRAIGLSDNDVLDKLRHPEYYQKSIEASNEEGISSEDQALLELYKKLRPGEPPSVSGGQQLLHSRFFDPKRYDLGRVGRYKINKKLRLTIPDAVRTLTAEDVLSTIDYLINLELDVGGACLDDIDHLGNRRVRSVGELLQNQVRVGLNRLERIIKERMTVGETESLTPAQLVNPKPLVAAVKEFFGSSQLSQFMDQTNPLAELTHKRRISALGPGGLTRERAGFAVRDIHPSHYGRICPIETPEGPNAGLIGSLATHARVNEYGFIETPFWRVENGIVIKQGDPLYLSADLEDECRVAPGDVPTDADGRITARSGACPLPPGLREGAPRAGGLRAALAGAGDLGGHLADPLPGARRRQPGPDGLQHAAPGGAPAAAGASAGGHRSGNPGGPRLRHGADHQGERHGRLRGCHRHRHPRRAGPGPHPLPAEVPALQPGHLPQPAADRPPGGSGDRRPGAGQRFGLRGRRDRPGPERADRLHALGGLQLRGRHPRQ